MYVITKAPLDNPSAGNPLKNFSTLVLCCHSIAALKTKKTVAALGITIEKNRLEKIVSGMRMRGNVVKRITQGKRWLKKSPPPKRKGVMKYIKSKNKDTHIRTLSDAEISLIFTHPSSGSLINE